MTFEQLLSYNHLIVVIAISGLITAVKVTLDKAGVLDKVVVQAILPWAPMLLGAAAGFIPGAINAEPRAFAVCIGMAVGAISGQVWKILKTKLSVLKGNL